VIFFIYNFHLVLILAQSYSYEQISTQIKAVFESEQRLNCYIVVAHSNKLSEIITAFLSAFSF